MKFNAVIILISLIFAGCKAKNVSLPTTDITTSIYQPKESNIHPVYSQDSIYKMIRWATADNGNVIPFYYFNNEWILDARIDMVSADSILNMEIKDDEYGNRAIFVTLPNNLIDSIKLKVKEETKEIYAEYGPFYEFPGGTVKMIEWVKENIRVPENFEGSERVVVSFMIQPDGTVHEGKMIKASENELVNKEALRLVSSFPKFNVWYYTPKKEPIYIALPILFQDTKTIRIRGTEK